jgi:hypothetical protein
MHGSLAEVRQAKRGPGLSAKQGTRQALHAELDW